MLKLFYFFIILCFFCFNSYAQSIITCPTVADIKRGQFHEWLPEYIANEELASDKDVLLFEHSVTRFALAKWDKSYLESGHCFYEGNDPIVTKITFAHDAWRPQQNGAWQWQVQKVRAACVTEDLSQCGFIE